MVRLVLVIWADKEIKATRRSVTDVPRCRLGAKSQRTLRKVDPVRDLGQYHQPCGPSVGQSGVEL